MRNISDSFHLFSKRFANKQLNLIIAGDGWDLMEVKEYVEEKKIQILFSLVTLPEKGKRSSF